MSKGETERKLRALAARAKDPKDARAIEHLAPGRSDATRNAAARALGKARGGEAMEALGLALRGGLRAAAVALGASRHAAAPKILRAVLARPALLSVAKVRFVPPRGDPEAAKKRLESGRRRVQRLAFVREVFRAALAHRDDAALRAAVLRFWRRSRDSTLLYVVGQQLEKVRDPEFAREALLATVGSNNRFRRQLAAKLLRRLPRREVFALVAGRALSTATGQSVAQALLTARRRPEKSPELLDLLRRCAEVSALRPLAVHGLALWGGSEAVEALVGAFPHTPSWLRPRVLVALLKARDKRATPFLGGWLLRGRLVGHALGKVYALLRSYRDRDLAPMLAKRRARRGAKSREGLLITGVLVAWGVEEGAPTGRVARKKKPTASGEPAAKKPAAKRLSAGGRPSAVRGR